MLPYVLGGVAVLLLLILVLVYNGLVSGRNETQNAWAQIDVQLKRRHELIPNLVEVVRGYARHEAETLERVVRARGDAMRAGAAGPEAAGQAESVLGRALRGLFALAEGYPALQASQGFLALQEELSSTENRIGFARQAYNDAATRFNTRREVFPANLVSGAFGFRRASLFVIDDAAERSVPSVGA
jgi:LemA protein